MSLTVGQTTYTQADSSPSMLLTVGNDHSSNFSSFEIDVAFESGNFIVAGGLASLDWSGNFFPNGIVPATLPPLSQASDRTLIVNVIGPSGTIADQTLSLTSVASCSPPTQTGQTSLKLTLMHKGNFTQAQTDATYSISVQNNGTAANTGMVTVIDTLPTALIATAMNGPGWGCVLPALLCTRSDPLSAGASYPPIILTVIVASDAVAQVTNQASVSNSGLAAATTSDVTSIQAPFVDVSPTDSFLPAIDLLLESGITTGCGVSPPQYCPNDNISQAQMAVFIVRSVMGSDNFTYTQTPYFSDVPAGNLYLPWIQKMQDLGIALPCSATQFCPDTPVTRGVMAVLIIRGRYASPQPSSVPATPYFTDVPSNHPYFTWIQKMKQVGITSGCSPTTYCPDDPVTRGQMAVFIERGEFNELLPAGTPVVVWLSAASASPGSTLTVAISGQNTNFVSGFTQVNAGAGIAVSNVAVSNGSTLTAQFAISPGAALGPRSIVVTTGNEEATLPNGIFVQ